MAFLSHGAEVFISLFQEGGKTLTGQVTGILPTLACLLVIVKAVIKFIGEDKLEKFAANGSENIFVRYMVLPILSYFVLTNPMCYSMSRFLPEKYKASFIDDIFSFAHPFTGLFPHTDPGELFIWLGIAAGIQKLGLSTGGLALRYLLAGVVLGFMRSIITEKLWMFFAKKNNLKIDDAVA
ncbi:MAG: srlA [Clostridiaceae bacterium]|nr:srlA [Clostridiaceae bacterium]